MTESNVSRRESLRLAALGVAGAAVAMGGSTLVAAPAQAAPQPLMRTALAELETALNTLNHAAHDKGGNREKAIPLVQQAIDYVKAGIAIGNI